jgi:hypothetical protein
LLLSYDERDNEEKLHEMWPEKTTKEEKLRQMRPEKTKEGSLQKKSAMHEHEATQAVAIQEKSEAPVVHGTQKTKVAAEKKNKRVATPGGWVAILPTQKTEVAEEKRAVIAAA